ncbi:hypothetical protein CEXT_613611 [Caerostris extrusa]|uniref:Uncharacterized protein n=1 Tax=Caerostris extrusa TaxID=172846 RepID=A0AAV4T8I6_CAEEX|nr:hypothetical protein CEXT_613611 [Caerostris extrusa]
MKKKKSRHEDLSFRTQRFVQQAAFLSFSSSFDAHSPPPTSNENIPSSSAACHLLFAAQQFFQQQIKERFVKQAVFLSFSSSFEAHSPPTSNENIPSSSAACHIIRRSAVFPAADKKRCGRRIFSSSSSS